MSWGQKDSIQSIEEVLVSVPLLLVVDTKSEQNMLTSQEIKEINANDVGELVSRFAGVNLKSYGGLGGMKTVSSRSLGAQHTAVVLDGFVFQQAQTGQINFGQIQPSNVIAISDSKSTELKKNLPVSAVINGSTFFIQRFENSFGKEELAIRTSAGYGSFDRFQGDLAIRYRPKKWLFSATGSYRSSEGLYPFTYRNGYQTISAFRMNNDYNDYNFSATIGRQFKKSVFRMGYSNLAINQGLPGAVIFYNNTQNERLSTHDQRIFSDYEWAGKKLAVRSYVQAYQGEMRYSDPDYLFGVGLQTDYSNRYVNGGVTLLTKLKGKWNVHGGVEMIMSDLIVSDSSFVSPKRTHLLGSFRTNYLSNRMEVIAQVSSQLVNETTTSTFRSFVRLNPFVSITHKIHDGKFQQHLWYRNSFRMPSFNELYYNTIGNIELKPEDAHQVDYGWQLLPFKDFKLLRIRTSGFVNLVDNKIVAIPTQNLFIWSMQNVGRVFIYGGEVMIDTEMKIGQNWKFSSQVNYTFQKSLDITDKGSPTYLDQIAYTPVHSGNIGFRVEYRSTGIRISNYLVSKRYSLNENIETNEVEGFWVADVTLFHRFEWKKNTITASFSVNNIFNEQYAFIRAYSMPGTNCLITLRYAFN